MPLLKWLIIEACDSGMALKWLIIEACDSGKALKSLVKKGRMRHRGALWWQKTD